MQTTMQTDERHAGQAMREELDVDWLELDATQGSLLALKLCAKTSAYCRFMVTEVAAAR